MKSLNEVNGKYINESETIDIKGNEIIVNLLTDSNIGKYSVSIDMGSYGSQFNFNTKEEAIAKFQEEINYFNSKR